VIKTKEMIVDYSKRRNEQAAILIDGAVVEQIESFKFLGIHITNKLTWSKHTKTVVKRAQQNIFPLRRLKRFGMGHQILKRFYSCTIESILVWQLLSFRQQGRKALQSVVRMAQYITWAKLHAIQDLYTRQCQRKALKIDSSHPSHRLFSLLPHGKRYRSAKSRSKRLLNSIHPKDITANQMATQTICISPLFYTAAAAIIYA
jgi:hypothetical protein